MNLKSYAWLTVLAMLLALFVPLASVGAQEEPEDPVPTGERAEDGGTLNAVPESATNAVDDPHAISVTVVDDDEGEPENDVTVFAAVDETGEDAASYEGGLPETAIETCTTGEGENEDGQCQVVFNDEDDEYEEPTPGKDRIRVWRDDDPDGDPETWDDAEDHDFVTKTWVDVADEEAGTDAETDGEAVRLWGGDRIETAVDVSQDHWLNADGTELEAAAHQEAEEAQNVVIARADVFPDALAGTPFAVLEEAPLLLTFPDSLDERTEEELERVLDPEDDGTVYLLGGVHAISQNVEDRIEDLGYDVERLFGVDRFDTAIDIAEEIESEQGSLDHIFIARSHEFADALAGGAAAANVEDFDAEAEGEGEVGAILLTWFDRKEEDTERFLSERDGTEADDDDEADEPDATTYALGGPIINPYACAVTVSAEDNPWIESGTWHTQSDCRDDEDTADWTIFGADRQETSRAIAEFFFVEPVDVGIARGDRFPDALTGGAHIGQFNGPILLTQTGELDEDAERYLCYQADVLETAYVYGGNDAIAPGTFEAADDAIDGAECDEHERPGHWVGS